MAAGAGDCAAAEREREDECGNAQGPRHASDRRIISDQESRGAGERGHNDRRHLPVPVEAGMYEEGDVGACGGGNVRGRASAYGRGQRWEEHKREESEADRAKLCECFEVERMGVKRSRMRQFLSGASPVDRERSRAGAEHGVRAIRVMPGYVPVGRTRLSGARTGNQCAAPERSTHDSRDNNPARTRTASPSRGRAHESGDRGGSSGASDGNQREEAAVESR